MKPKNKKYENNIGDHKIKIDVLNKVLQNNETQSENDDVVYKNKSFKRFNKILSNNKREVKSQ